MAGRYQATLMTSGLKPILNKAVNAALKRCSNQKTRLTPYTKIKRRDRAGSLPDRFGLTTRARGAQRLAARTRATCRSRVCRSCRWRLLSLHRGLVSFPAEAVAAAIDAS